MSTGFATFETVLPSWEEWNEKFINPCRLVALIENQVVAWCALSMVSKRQVYKGVAEDTIYVAKEFQGQGIGKLLLNHLIASSEQEGFWTLQAGIFAENLSSIQLHKNCGFRVVGVRKKIAKRNGIWHDNVLMERRSKKINL